MVEMLDAFLRLKPQGLSRVESGKLPDDTGQFLEQLVGHGYRSGVRRETTLGDNQLSEFVGDIDIGQL